MPYLPLTPTPSPTVYTPSTSSSFTSVTTAAPDLDVSDLLELHELLRRHANANADAVNYLSYYTQPGYISSYLAKFGIGSGYYSSLLNNYNLNGYSSILNQYLTYGGNGGNGKSTGGNGNSVKTVTTGGSTKTVAAGAATTSGPSRSSGSSGGGGLSTGAAAGIGAGGVVIAILIGLAIWWYCKKYKMVKRTPPEAGQPELTQVPPAAPVPVPGLPAPQHGKMELDGQQTQVTTMPLGVGPQNDVKPMAPGGGRAIQPQGLAPVQPQSPMSATASLASSNTLVGPGGGYQTTPPEMPGNQQYYPVPTSSPPPMHPLQGQVVYGNPQPVEMNAHPHVYEVGAWQQPQRPAELYGSQQPGPR